MGGMVNYQRLEFLGDRVLGLMIADILFHRFPREGKEGELSRRLSELVRRETCAQVAENWDVGPHIRLRTRCGAHGQPAPTARSSPISANR